MASPGVDRLISAFSLSVPPLGFLSLIYVCLSDAVFSINLVVGKRLYAPLRFGGRAAYLAVNAAGFVSLHFALAFASGGAVGLFQDGCDAAPRVLHDRTCLLLTASGALLHAGAMLADRVAIPLLGIGDDARGYARGWRARFLEAAATSVLWMAVAEVDATAVLIVSAQSARRWTGSCLALLSVRSKGPFAVADWISSISTRLYILFFKLLALGHMASLLATTSSNVCSGAQRRLAVGTVLALSGLS